MNLWKKGLSPRLPNVSWSTSEVFNFKIIHWKNSSSLRFVAAWAETFVSGNLNSCLYFQEVLKMLTHKFHMIRESPKIMCRYSAYHFLLGKQISPTTVVRLCTLGWNSTKLSWRYDNSQCIIIRVKFVLISNSVHTCIKTEFSSYRILKEFKTYTGYPKKVHNFIQVLFNSESRYNK